MMKSSNSEILIGPHQSPTRRAKRHSSRDARGSAGDIRRHSSFKELQRLGEELEVPEESKESSCTLSSTFSSESSMDNDSE